jgi:hypothetical protein
MRIFSFGDFKMTDKKIGKKVVEVPIVPEVIPAHVEARELFIANQVAGIATAKDYAATLGALFEGFDWVDWKGNGSAKSCNMTKAQFDSVTGERAACKSALAIALDVDVKDLKNFDSKWQYVVTNSEITIERKRLQAIKDAEAAAEAAAAAAAAALEGDTPEGDAPEGDAPEGDTSEKTDLDRMIQHIEDAIRLATKEGIGCHIGTHASLVQIIAAEKTNAAAQLVAKAIS